MVEPEVAFLDLDGLMELAENYISHIVQSVLKNRSAELDVIGRDKTKLENVKPPFPRITYGQACYMINKAHKDGDLDEGIEPGDDFGSPQETWLSSQYDRPVMVHRYPADVKAFYMEPDPNDPRLALCVDVLAPEGYGEVIGGSQRVSSYELLSQRIADHKLPREAFEWYLDLRRYGSVPHAGFGMGIERMVSWICSLDHVRETIPFPRMLNRMYP
jgi:asparaginyl-tRNA synthetase